MLLLNQMEATSYKAACTMPSTLIAPRMDLRTCKCCTVYRSHMVFLVTSLLLAFTQQAHVIHCLIGAPQ